MAHIRSIDSSLQEPTATAPAAHEDLSCVSGGRNPSSGIVAVSRWVADLVHHRFIVDDPKRVINYDDLPLLVEPLTTRVCSGILAQRESDPLTFACGVINGGLPLEVLIKDPCIDLSMDGQIFQTLDGSRPI